MKTDTNNALIELFLEDMTHTKIPHALEIKSKLDLNQLLNEFDLHFLEDAVFQGQEILYSLAFHSEYRDIILKVLALFTEIPHTALEKMTSSSD